MKKEEFDALCEIFDAIVSLSEARDSSDGGLIETIRLTQLKKDFERKFVVEE